tara:strand:- start:1585 stop:1869 length:285 start_codon:yes stop_codon:yes gene_type:complete
MQLNTTELKEKLDTLDRDIDKQFEFYRDILLDYKSEQIGASANEFLEDDQFSFIMGCYPNMIISRHIGSRCASIVIYKIDTETFEVNDIFAEGL